ncbi:hypothetical protein GOBAR_AA07222 [Gossypium barbadense]|uniref:Uncharacterized protein n=1 Tax=Gossypium barbadense TaxID=3634 RepID=A0A2P5YCL5_GOSBA|nr:hypothetical protein GOBAR_AA07222 [Gossypium barbadense]
MALEKQYGDADKSVAKSHQYCRTDKRRNIISEVLGIILIAKMKQSVLRKIHSTTLLNHPHVDHTQDDLGDIWPTNVSVEDCSDVLRRPKCRARQINNMAMGRALDIIGVVSADDSSALSVLSRCERGVRGCIVRLKREKSPSSDSHHRYLASCEISLKTQGIELQGKLRVNGLDDGAHCKSKIRMASLDRSAREGGGTDGGEGGGRRTRDRWSGGSGGEKGNRGQASGAWCDLLVKASLGEGRARGWKMGSGYKRGCRPREKGEGEGGGWCKRQ